MTGGGKLSAIQSELNVLYRIIDWLLIVIVLYVAVRVRGIVWNDMYTFLGVFVAVVYALNAQLAQVYVSWRTALLFDMAKPVLLSWFVTMFVILFLGYGTKTSAEFSRIVVILWFVCTPFILILWRQIFLLSIRSFRKQGFNTRTFAVIGFTDESRKIINLLKDTASTGMVFVGGYDDRVQDLVGFDQLRAGTIDQAIERAKQGQIDVVYIGLPFRDEEMIKEIVSALADTTSSVYIVPNLLTADLIHSRWMHVGDMPVVSVFETPFLNLNRYAKRLEDLVITLLVLPIISVPMVIIAILIKLDSPGPVFFRQSRYGLRGKEILVWKYRTMYVSKDDARVKQATKNDFRVTKVGSVLRRYSLDELPQFFNVLFGQMSVVGPRPHASIHNEAYRRLIHGYMLRHTVKPGITGWAQVNGWRGETDALEKMEKRLQFDHWYIMNWNIFLDVKIVLRTVFLLLTPPASTAY